MIEEKDILEKLNNDMKSLEIPEAISPENMLAKLKAIPVSEAETVVSEKVVEFKPRNNIRMIRTMAASIAAVVVVGASVAAVRFSSDKKSETFNVAMTMDTAYEETAEGEESESLDFDSETMTGFGEEEDKAIIYDEKESAEFSDETYEAFEDDFESDTVDGSNYNSAGTVVESTFDSDKVTTIAPSQDSVKTEKPAAAVAGNVVAEPEISAESEDAGSEDGFIKDVLCESNDVDALSKDGFVLNSEREDMRANTTVSDEGLTMLAEYCEKTEGTVGGNGYTEIVLYKRGENEYEVHSYSKYEDMDEEAHYAYKSSEEVADKVIEFTKQAKLSDYENSHDYGMVGKTIVVKFLEGEKMYRITSYNVDEDKLNLLYEVGKIIGESIKEENEI